ncbi:N-acetylglucosamine kinase [Cypionkella aquatica]|uniref:N-acetylglucosamine kinase n=1 Tax=Cypionkella aquatica TaxID=1756042 RepID=A0AA37U696_9RHOB|nr:ROK family protein [Cypionkella aquatica]GLS86321.1 N-acetylglucosamine kinase [Cypionkella aquatica]
MILAFDIGGSRIKAARSHNGQLTPLGETATPADDFAAFAAALAGFHSTETAVAISITGVVDPTSGRIKVANIPCLDTRNVSADLQAALGLPVLILNDADCFAMAEATSGAGRNRRNVFGVILGTGVGGGLILNGQIVTGPGGYAGEWGHGPVVENPALPCGCGQIGCLDTVGGARGIERLHLHFTGQTASAQAIIAAWRAGDQSTMPRWLDLVSGQLAMVVNLIGAEIVPVGGGLANDTVLIACLDQAVRARILRQTHAALVVPATVSADAGLAGAAAAGEARFG